METTYVIEDLYTLCLSESYFPQIIAIIKLCNATDTVQKLTSIIPSIMSLRKSVTHAGLMRECTLLHNDDQQQIV